MKMYGFFIILFTKIYTMKNTEVERKYALFCNLVINKKLVDAFHIFDTLIAEIKNEENKIEYNKLKETYFLMLNYSINNTNDPHREKIYNTLVKQLLNLADIIKENIYALDGTMQTYTYKRRINKYAINSSEKINELLEIQKNGELKSVEKEFGELFNVVWFTDKYSKQTSEKMLELFLSPDTRWYHKCLIVSSITLSLIRCFDIEKINLLFAIIQQSEPQIYERALVGLLISLNLHDERLKYYPEITKTLKAISFIPDFNKNVENILMQFIKAKETEQIANRLKNEILPEMAKYTPRINEKLDLDKIISDSMIEDKNPDWEEIFDDAPEILDKMQELSMLQLDGSDVLMGTFDGLKFYPFFHNIANWFYPYTANKMEIMEMVNKSTDKEIDLSAAQGLESTHYICNSDKYSFLFNLVNVPIDQRKMMVAFFKMETEEVNVIKKDEELINPNAKSKFIIIQYIQDLYRFFKLNNLKHEFKDIFNLKLDIYNKSFFNLIVYEIETIKSLTDLYFKKNFYESAKEVYELLLKRGEVRQEIYEKIAYSCQRMQLYNEAVANYHKAEFFDANTLWITKKIAFCHIKLNNYEKALEYYKKAETEEPENLLTLTNIGHCYLNLNDYENALKNYFKVEYYSPSNIKVLRPIAWCSFILNKFEASKKYYLKLIAKEVNSYDYMNLGHIAWCQGDKIEAVEYYKKAIEKSKDIESFVKDFNEDTKHLINKGIEEFEVQLTLDFLKMYKSEHKK